MKNNVASRKGSCRDGAQLAAPLLVPGPVGELFAEGCFFEFAYAGAGDFREEDEGVGELPFGEGLGEEGAEFFGGGGGTFFQDHDG